jgi:branched-chain amino acid aminotransferase
MATTISRSATLAASAVGTANLDWPNLGFEYRHTDSYVKCEYKNGQWGECTIESDPYVKVHIGATALHYGQACFEGLKAFQAKNGKVYIFRPDENADRITNSCKRICMPPLPKEKFLEAMKTVVQKNLAYVPPYGNGGALYIRPLLFGSGPRIGLQPADEYTFIALAIPVADYYKGGLKPVHAVVVTDYDRAAPRGVGAAKVAGNYAADLLPNMAAKKAGFPIALYLDAKTNKYIEEFSTSNFLAIDKSTGAYVTPKSEAILASITNKSLMELAADEGMDVQRRQITIDEVMDGKFSEIAACGTAVVVTPVNKVTFGDRTLSLGDSVGPSIEKLYRRVRSIQNGEAEDKFNWLYEV